MKRKYHGMICVTLAFFTLAALFGYSLFLADRLVNSIHIPGLPPVSDTQVPGETTLAYMDFLSSGLVQILQEKQMTVPVNLRLFSVKAQLPRALPRATVPEPAETSRTVFSYTLSLTLTSSLDKFCIIDKNLYKENGLLPDGAKVLKIENDRVLILKNREKQWIYPQGRYPQGPYSG